MKMYSIRNHPVSGKRISKVSFNTLILANEKAGHKDLYCSIERTYVIYTPLFDKVLRINT